MAWTTVERGPIGEEQSFAVERQVVRLKVPMSTAWLDLPRKAYRWRLVSGDGSAETVDRAKTRPEIDRAVERYRQTDGSS